MRAGERQVAASLSGIRRDHTERYRWAVSQLPDASRVIDLACGVGYGAFILASAGHHVLAIDNDAEAIAYGKRYYQHPNITWRLSNADEIMIGGSWDAATCFETIEHLRDPLPMLTALRQCCQRLFASVPNEAVFPHAGRILYHFRHYTRTEFNSLLREAGWRAKAWLGQAGPESSVETATEGRTLIVTATPDDYGVGIDDPVTWIEGADVADETILIKREPLVHPQIDHVAIVGLGPSAATFFDMAKCLGGASGFCDEVWGINGIGDTLRCDRIFHMDDMRVQEMRAEAKPDGNIAQMVRWMRHTKVPVFTSIVREEYPSHVAYPLEEILNAGLDTGAVAYFNSTTAYAIAYAIHIGVKQISLFGVDYTQPNVHHGERGRACCEYWLGIAAARGIAVTVPDTSTLLDACAPDRERLYGYDMVDVHLLDGSEGRLAVTFTERSDPPTAADVERAYDHKNVHTNRLLAANAAE